MMDVASDHDRSLMLMDGRLYETGCVNGGLLPSEQENVWIPRPVPGLEHVEVTGVVSGNRHAIALTAEGRAFSFGSSQFGQLGVGHVGDAFRAPAPVGLEGVVAAAAGDVHTLLIDGSGKAWQRRLLAALVSMILMPRGMTREVARKRPMYELAFIVGAVVLAVGGVVAGVLFAVLRIPGEEIASIDVVPGEPFALDAVATGAPLRVWMAIECEFCANAVATGELEVRTGGRVVASHRFHGGGARLFADDQSGGRMSHRGDLLFSVPAQPAGTPMTLNGTSTLPPASAGVTVWPPENFGERTATRVKLHAFRVYLAP